MTYVKFAVPHSKLDADLVSRIKAAEAALIAVREEAQKAYLASDEGRGVLVMDAKEYGRSSISFKWPELTPGAATHGFGITVNVQEDYDAKHLLRQPSVPIGEKTLNALLTGKLLTEAQKKALLKRIGVDLDYLDDLDTSAA